MSHGKKTGIAIVLSIFICLIGLVGSFAGSLRYAMRNSAIETLAQEWEISRMKITKIAGDLTMAGFLKVMMEVPEISEECAANLIDADYTREFIASKIRDYREDLLKNTGEGKVAFSELVLLEEEKREEVRQALQYSLSTAEVERYEMVWDNLALTQRTALSVFREDRPALFAFARIILSGWFLAAAVLLCVPGAGAAFWYLYGRSFKGYRIYGLTLVIIGIADCIVGFLHESFVSKVNSTLNMQSNLMTLLFTPVSNMLLTIGALAILMGIIAFVLRTVTKNRR